MEELPLTYFLINGRLSTFKKKEDDITFVSIKFLCLYCNLQWNRVWSLCFITHTLNFAVCFQAFNNVTVFCRVIVLESSYLFLTEGMYTSGYITVNVTKRLKNWKKLCILIQIKSELLELFYLAFHIPRLSVDSMRSVFLFHILNDRNN